MTLERTQSGASLIDVLDRVLDKGIVIDAWVRLSLVGIDLVMVEARVVVASIDTYLRYTEAWSTAGLVARPSLPSRDGAVVDSAEHARARAVAEFTRRPTDLN